MRVGQMARPDSQGERGAALMAALILIAVVSLIIFAVLAFAETGFDVAGASSEHAADVYAADAGIEAAIELIRTYPDLGRAKDEDCGLPEGIDVDGFDVEIECQPMPWSGEAVLDSGSVAPDHAILALNEFKAQNTLNQQIHVRGPVSARTLTLQGAQTFLRVEEGYVEAQNACDPAKIDADEGLNCSNPAAPADDPNYPPEQNSWGGPPVPSQSVPSCSADVSTPVEFEPGRYTHGKQISDLINSNSCERTFIFKPGVYWFDFQGGAQNTLNINTSSNPNTRVIAGTLDASGESCDPESDGVQFIFGGNSRLSVGHGHLHICPRLNPTATEQRIAIYGVKADTGQLTALTSSAASNLIDVSGPSTNFIVKGTIYAPSGTVKVHQNNSGIEVLARGIIIYDLDFQITGSVSLGNEPSILIPEPCFGSLGPREFLLTAYAGGIVTQARVFIDDPETFEPAAGCPPPPGGVPEYDSTPKFGTDAPDTVVRAWRVEREQ